MWRWKRKKLHDGYYTVRDSHGNLSSMAFYQHSRLYRAVSGKHPRVDQEKAEEFEDMCEASRRGFMEGGKLRLHTPIGQYQERLGTIFLYVPPDHRVRIAEVIEGGSLVMEDPFEKFAVISNVGRIPTKDKSLADLLSGGFRLIGNNKRITMADLLCGEELVDIGTSFNQNIDDHNRGAITQEEFERRRDTIIGWVKTKFRIQSVEIAGMFV